MKEIKELRKSREKHYLKNDGTFVAQIFDDDIHYIKNNTFKEIDNTLILKDNYYENKNNNYKIKFKSSIDDEVFNISKNNYYLSFNLNNINGKRGVIKNKNKLDSEIIYENVYPKISFKYELLSNKIKESIIIYDKKHFKKKIDFKFKTNMDLKLNEFGEIILSSDKENMFIINKPFMYDQNNEININIYYELKNNHIILHLDEEWLKDDKRIYPVIIDPTLTNYGSETSVTDTYIYEGDTNVNRYLQDKLVTGVI